MKPVYQFPIPPLRPSSSVTNASSSTLKEANERDHSSEPIPKKLRTDDQENSIAQHSNQFGSLFNSNEPATSVQV